MERGLRIHGNMKRVLRVALVLLVAMSFTTMANAIVSKKTTLQSAATATGNGTTAKVQGYTTAAIQVTGTFVGTVSFEASLDNTNFDALECFPINNRSLTATTATATGTWRCNITGIAGLRGRISAYTSGSITVNTITLAAGVF